MVNNGITLWEINSWTLKITHFEWKRILLFEVIFARVELLIYQRDPEGNLYYHGLI